MHGVKILALIVAALLIAPAQADDEELWQLLRTGGQFVFVRHTVTTPGVGDPEGMRLEDCSSQRNLTDEGRSHARRIGAAFKERKVRVARVLSSPWCRCVETAGIAFGSADISPPLGNLFGRQHLRAKQVAEMRELLKEPPAAGNVVLVSHGSTILALTGISPATGEAVVLTPQGGGRFSVAGRLQVP